MLPRVFLVMFLLTLSLAGCSILPSPVPGGGTTSRPSLAIQALWYRQSQSGDAVDEALLAPRVKDGRLYFADIRGQVLALDAHRGRRLWRVSITEEGGETAAITAGPGLQDDLLLLGTREGGIIALDARDGAVRWRGRVSSEVLSPPVSDGRVVVVHVNDGRVFGLDARTGRSLWIYESSVPALSLRGTSAPVLDGRKVILGLANGKLLALSLREGKVIWETTVAVPRGRSELDRIVDVDATPVVRDGVVYAVAYHGRVVAASTATGRILWSRDISSYRDLAVDDERLYLTDEKGVVLALDRRGGAVLWKQDAFAGRHPTAPALDQGMVVVGDDKGRLHWLLAEDGSLLASRELAPASLPGPLLTHGGGLYLKDRRNALYGLRVEKVGGDRDT